VGRYGHRKRKTLKVWLFVCGHALSGKEPKLEGLVDCLCPHSDEQIINQEIILCKRVIYTASFHTGFAKMWDVAI
jgi:hypothetical protein